MEFGLIQLMRHPINLTSKLATAILKADTESTEMYMHMNAEWEYDMI